MNKEELIKIYCDNISMISSDTPKCPTEESLLEIKIKYPEINENDRVDKALMVDNKKICNMVSNSGLSVGDQIEIYKIGVPKAIEAYKKSIKENKENLTQEERNVKEAEIIDYLDKTIDMLKKRNRK